MEAFLRRLYEECVDILFPETASLPYHGGGHEAEVFLEVHQDATGDSAVAGGKFQSPAGMRAGDEGTAHAEQRKKLRCTASRIFSGDPCQFIFNLFCEGHQWLLLKT